MAYHCDGSASHLQSPSVFNDDNAVSASFWVRIPTGHGNAQFDRIWELAGFGSSPLGGLGLEVNSPTTNLAGVVWPLGSSIGNYTYTLDTWFNVIFVSDASTPDTKWYADGVQQGSNTTNARVTTQETFTFGGRNTSPNNEPSVCDVADCAIWHGALLTADERAVIAAGYSPLFLARKPTSYYPMIREVTDVIDGQDLTVTGATVQDHPPIIYPSTPIIGIPTAAVVAANPKGPLGHPFHGPFAGPIG